MSLSFTIRQSNGNRFDVTLAESSTLESATVRHVKEAIQTAHADLPVDQQRLIYKGKILDNERVLSDYGMVPNATLHLVMARAATAPNTTTPAAAVAASTPRAATTAPITSNAAATAPTPPAAAAAIPPFNPLMNPFAAAAGGGANASNNNMWQQLQQQQQQQMMQDPEMMQQMLNSPLMQNLLDNPQVFQNMMEMNPQVRQLLDQNPELRQLFSDPQLMRQSMDLMRNPQHMQYLMRQQDLAMSQLENLPGGFSALSNMYHTVQEPMMEAMVDQRSNNNNSGAAGNNSGATTSTSATAGATGQAMPNPWGSPSSSRPSLPPRPSAPSGIPPSSNRNVPPTTANSIPTAPVPPFGASSAAAANPWNFPVAPPSSAMMGLGAGGVPSPEQLEQTLQALEQNPRMQQVFDQIFSDPQMLQTVLGSSPMMQQLRQQNPMAYDMMMQNPQMLREMMNPQQLRTMMQLQQSMQGGGGLGSGGLFGGPAAASGGLFGAPGANPMLNPWGAPSPSAGTPGGATAGSSAAAPLDFSSLLQQYQSLGLGGGAFGGPGFGGPGFGGPAFGGQGFGGAGPAAPAAAPVLPADRFRHQLQSLYDMGFDDEQANLAALQLHHGNVNRAIDALLTGTVPPTPAAPPAPAATTTTQESAPTAPASDSNSTSNDNTSSSEEVNANHPKKDVAEKKND